MLSLDLKWRSANFDYFWKNRKPFLLNWPVWITKFKSISRTIFDCTDSLLYSAISINHSFFKTQIDLEIADLAMMNLLLFYFLLILFFCMLSFCCSLSTIQFQKWFQERPHRPTGQGLLPFPATLPTRPNRPIRPPNIKPKWPNRPIIMLSLLLRAVGPLLPPYPKWPCPKWIYPKLAYPNYPLAGLVGVAIDLTMSTLPTLPTLPMPTPSLLPPLSTDIMEILDRNSKFPKKQNWDLNTLYGQFFLQKTPNTIPVALCSSKNLS